MIEKIKKALKMLRSGDFAGFFSKIFKKIKYFISKVIKTIGLSVSRLFFYRKNKQARQQAWVDLSEYISTHEFDRIILWKSDFGWQTDLFQRPQHIARCFAREKCLMLYEVTHKTDDVDYWKEQEPDLLLINFSNFEIDQQFNILMSQIDKPKYLQIYSTDFAMSLEQMLEYKKHGYKILYEYIDDISPAIAGTDKMPVNILKKYQYVLKHQDIPIVVTAEALKQDVIAKRGNKNLIFSGNGVDFDHFQTIDQDYIFEPKFQSIINQDKPIIGYYGALATWTDYELIKKIANTNKYEIVLIGVKYDDSYDKNQLDRYSNIVFLGAKPYRDLKNYSSKMNVLTIPFLINDVTKATSPIKIFEYMAVGKPIVTTDLTECRKYKSALIGKTHQDFIDQLDKALDLQNNLEYQALLKKEALANTWGEKAKIILNQLD